MISNLLFAFSLLSATSNLVYTEAEENFTTLYPLVTISAPASFEDMRIADLNEDGSVYVELRFTSMPQLMLVDGSNEYYLARYPYYLNYTWTREQYGDESDGYLGIVNTQYYFSYLNFDNVFTTTPNDLIQLPKPYKYYVSNVYGTGDYVNGYNQGKAEGSAEGYLNGRLDGIEEGKDISRNDILSNPNNYDLYSQFQYDNYGALQYEKGVNYGAANADQYTLRGLISAVFMAPILFVERAFNFELFSDISFSSLIKFLFTIALCIGIYKFITGNFGGGSDNE